VQIGPPQFEGAHFVDANNRRGAYDAGKYLASLGYRRIGLITGPLDKAEARDRLIGCLDGLAECGVSPLPEWIAEGNFDEPSGYRAMRRLLRHDLQAVFASNDSMALGALRALDEAGLRVPDQMALVGFDDMPFAATTKPPLCTSPSPTSARRLRACCSSLWKTGRQSLARSSCRPVLSSASRVDQADEQGEDHSR
jgi:LacI family transcriptional regulator